MAEESDASLLSVSVKERPFCNLRLADDIGLLGSSEEELQQLTRRLEERAAEYGMEISSDMSNIKFSSTAAIYQHTDERTNARKSGLVKLS